jgi:signal transduction histidine kinase
MVAELKSQEKTLYDTDYNLWVLETVEKLKNRDFNSLDLDNLIEEVLDLSRQDKRKIQSLLIQLFEHLLKLKYWEAERPYNKGHWEAEIRNFRQQINIQLEDSPSLRKHISEVFNDSYKKGRALASDRSQLPLNTFPENPIATVERALDENWLP